MNPWQMLRHGGLDSTVNKGQSAGHPEVAQVKPPTYPISIVRFIKAGQVSAQIIWIHCPILLRFSADFTDFLYWDIDSSTRTKPEMPVIQTVHKGMFRLLLLAPISCILRFQVFSILKFCHRQCSASIISLKKWQIWSHTTVCPTWFQSQKRTKEEVCIRFTP